MNTIFVIINLIFLFLATIASYFFSKKMYTKGKKDEKQQAISDSATQALEIKKQEQINNNTPYDRVLDRMRKYTRD